jgi:hypothetical protein
MNSKIMKELRQLQKHTIYTTSLESSCFFKLIVGTTSTEQADIYEKKSQILLNLVQKKLGNVFINDAKLMTTENQVDVRIVIGMSTSSYIRNNLCLRMSTSEIKNELDDTRQDIKTRCTRVLQTLHDLIGDQVKQPVQDDDRIQVSWLDDYQFFY